MDAHYSGGITAKGKLDTPILEELHQILNHHVAGHVILIDDARFFVGRGGYPTLEEIRDLVTLLRPRSMFEIRDDIIRITPGEFGKRNRSRWHTGLLGRKLAYQASSAFFNLDTLDFEFHHESHASCTVYLPDRIPPADCFGYDDVIAVVLNTNSLLVVFRPLYLRLAQSTRDV